jgi:hypothetical protein
MRERKFSDVMKVCEGGKLYDGFTILDDQTPASVITICCTTKQDAEAARELMRGALDKAAIVMAVTTQALLTRTALA